MIPSIQHDMFGKFCIAIQCLLFLHIYKCINRRNYGNSVTQVYRTDEFQIILVLGRNFPLTSRSRNSYKNVRLSCWINAQVSIISCIVFCNQFLLSHTNIIIFPKSTFRKIFCATLMISFSTRCNRDIDG